MMLLVEAGVLEYVHCSNPVLSRTLLFCFSCLYFLVAVSSDNLALFIPNSLLSQNHRMVGVGRDLCGSSSPTLLPKQGHLQ